MATWQPFPDTHPTTLPAPRGRYCAGIAAFLCLADVPMVRAAGVTVEPLQRAAV
jgi:hypothetical protein